jgi:pilus assembly protein CpaE
VVSSQILGGGSAALRELIRSRLDAQGPAIADFDNVEGRLAEIQPKMVFVVLTPDPERALAVVRHIRRLVPGFMLVVGPAADPKFILRALNDGADHFLDEHDLQGGLEAILPRIQSKDETEKGGRLVAVVGASGGSGASTICVNLACVLAKDHGRCALVDLKPGRGDLAALLDLKPSYTLADVCVNTGRLDQAIFEKVLTQHSSGVQLLAAPQVFGDTRLINANGVSQALTMARKLFSHIVVDLEDCYHEEQVLALRQATAILVVSRLDFTSLRNVRRILDYFDKLEIAAGRIRLVINRYGQPNELPSSEAETALGGKVGFYIPDEPKTINGANNTGVPAVLKWPNAKVCQAIFKMGKEIFERRQRAPSAWAKMFAR